jgi:putative ABC transport system substrate-binding protein
MRALGYPEITLEVRAAAGQTDRLPVLVTELLALGVEVIVTDGGPAAVAAKQATAMVPIVIGAMAGDPVQLGLAATLARPGGNATGFTIATGAELSAKRLELLREAMPALKRVAVLWNPRNQVSRPSLVATETAAKTLGIQVEIVDARDGEEIDRAVGGAVRNGATAMLTIADAFLWSQRGRVVSTTNRHRLPAIYPEREFAEAGGLMAYGPNVPGNFHRAAGYVDKILKGTRPGDLPIEQPTKFELVLNLKTARTLGLTIPPSLGLRADQVIE